MKRILTLSLLLILAAPAYADKYVKGYTRGDGTYVQGYYRSNADGNFSNNFSTRGNTNPYTNQPGYVSRPPAGYGSSNRSYGYNSGWGSSSGYSQSGSGW